MDSPFQGGPPRGLVPRGSDQFHQAHFQAMQDHPAQWAQQAWQQPRFNPHQQQQPRGPHLPPPHQGGFNPDPWGQHNNYNQGRR